MTIETDVLAVIFTVVVAVVGIKLSFYSKDYDLWLNEIYPVALEAVKSTEEEPTSTEEEKKFVIGQKKSLRTFDELKHIFDNSVNFLYVLLTIETLHILFLSIFPNLFSNILPGINGIFLITMGIITFFLVSSKFVMEILYSKKIREYINYDKEVITRHEFEITIGMQRRLLKRLEQNPDLHPLLQKVGMNVKERIRDLKRRFGSH